MDKMIKQAYNECIYAEALERFGVQSEQVKALDGFESFIYEYTKDGREYILRVSHSSRRSANMIKGETEWINYLVDRGVSASRAISSLNGTLVEIIEAGDAANSYFSAASFVKAPGGRPMREDWQNGLMVTLGQTLGRMHALTKDYIPSDPAYRRPDWFLELAGFAEKYLPASDQIIIDKFNQLREHLKTLPTDRDAFGLVHIDAHGGNFFLDQGKITLFDFDDCQYNWFAADLAIALFYVLSHDCTGAEKLEHARKAYAQLLLGYSRENSLDPEWLKRIPLFLKQREIDLYICIHRSCDLEDLDPFCASFMANRREKIANDVPYVDIDFV